MSRPFLFFPAASDPVPRKTGRDIPASLDLPTPGRQKERLQAKFEAIQKALNSPNARITSSTAGTTPEEVIVLDVAGSVDSFLDAVAKVEGLDLLREFEVEKLEPDDDFQIKGKAEKPFDGRLYLLMSNQKAMTQILAYWDQWQSHGKVDRGFAPFKNVFSRLRDVRKWSVEDRLRETGLIEDWQQRVDDGYETVVGEIELWFHESQARRTGAESLVTALITEVGGQVVHRCVISEISYHAVLVEFPISAFPDLSKLEQIKLVQCSAIQFLRPVGQFAAPEIPPAVLPVESVPLEPANLSKAPRAALLDGMPMANHPVLRGRVLVDDPDGWESEYPADARRHGTAMASLILHGDLEAKHDVLDHLIYSRPILRPGASWHSPPPEESPEGQLFVDVVYRAVRRLFEATDAGPPAAPRVECINFSIGDRYRTFLDSLSPLARLLDWLSWKYKVLFIVSSGNYADELSLAVKRSDFSSLPRTEKRDHSLRALLEDSRNRRLLSPGESINALTVGATHYDEHPKRSFPTEVYDVFDGQRMVSPLSAQGPGYLRSIKPDVVAPGGRAIYGEKLSCPPDLTILEFKRLSRGPGLCHAGPQPGVGTGGKAYSVGSSNSAALVTRLGLQVLDELERLFANRDLVGLSRIPMSLWLKTLIAHSADWSNCRDAVSGVVEARELRETLCRLQGFGEIRPERALGCTDYRATVLAYGELEKDESHILKFPLPPILASKKVMRRLTLTLGYFTPIDPSSKDYRVAAVKFEPRKDGLLEMERSHAGYNDCKRGTLQHEIIEGDKAVSYVDGNFLTIDVSCREAAPTLTTKIPYTMAVSLEVATGTEIKIYDQIKARIQQPVPISARE
ncbi:MAG: S8 family peptidase [Vulcanimicrobiota bacterium]